ncbi:MAG: 4Fe-4S dicluster domain-containing protein [Clostridia bacterium]|nr:4Fe-4S dicluster domain-containing protein [Clostridia bacterium]
MPRQFIIPDKAKCLGCCTCLAACMLTHKEEGAVPCPRLFLTPTAQGSVPLQCRQCDQAPCAEVCPVHAFEVQGEVVVLNEKKCVGCGICVLACPIGCIEIQAARQAAATGITLATSVLLPLTRNEQDEKKMKKIAVKCDMCYFRPEGPACVNICPTKALRLVDEEDIRFWNLQRRQAYASSIGFQGADE